MREARQAYAVISTTKLNQREAGKELSGTEFLLGNLPIFTGSKLNWLLSHNLPVLHHVLGSFIVPTPSSNNQTLIVVSSENSYGSKTSF